MCCKLEPLLGLAMRDDRTARVSVVRPSLADRRERRRFASPNNQLRH